MGVFEDVMSKAKVAVDTAGKKTGDLVEIAKLKFAASEITGELKKRHHELGKLTYDSVKNDTDIKLKSNEIVNEIDELYVKLSIVNAQIDLIKNVVRCTDCGCSNSMESAFCNGCGCKLSKEDPPVNEKTGSNDNNPEI